MFGCMDTWRNTASRLAAETHAICLACRDPRTPWYAKLLAATVAAYAVSPIDLIPDFIPVLGYLDDLVLVPLGIWILLHMIPPQVMRECREKANSAVAQNGRNGQIAAIVIVCLWVLAVVFAVLGITKMYR